ncbi:hypothetical protein Ferp_2096 [Ferroglobus placidus DSM 10642]|uniref:Late embryogenesis abundant protein LEA-2 subgroup domain-containing protein n=1 Tax=Ferroglobus placidus (strain DSM 10642 / AEDII12DO) TaxID=589924 RepID=D3S0G4_FERPA|nr:LEA type 2 family protein [Ferroglobus placidus]ADC66227.1 hypothetical protein Ferp_2096 [Ferroglobus placidus DSM 10642]
MKAWHVLLILAIFVGIFVVLPTLPELFMGLGIRSNLIKPLSVEVQDITITGVSLKGLHGSLILSVTNPNPFPAQLDSIDFQVYTKDGTLVASGSIPYTNTIPPNSNKNIALNFNIPWTGGGKLILEKLKGFFTEQKTQLKVTGTVYIDLKATKIPIPFSRWVTV